jgi:hypothetical protein
MKRQEPVTGLDFLGSSAQYAAATQLLQDLNPVAHVVNTVLEAIDPEKFHKMLAFRAELMTRFPNFQALCTLDPSCYESLVVIYNRRSGRHRDKNDPKNSWALMTVVGSFVGGAMYFEDLGLRVEFGPGDILAIRGNALFHEVESWSGQLRISLVYFTHRSVWNYIGRELG